jgi:hypothetical protein
MGIRKMANIKTVIAALVMVSAVSANAGVKVTSSGSKFIANMLVSNTEACSNLLINKISDSLDGKKFTPNTVNLYGGTRVDDETNTTEFYTSTDVVYTIENKKYTANCIAYMVGVYSAVVNLPNTKVTWIETRGWKAID